MSNDTRDDHIEPNPPDRSQRLQKIVSQAGLGSRRQAEEFIIDGRIKVNGNRVELGARATIGLDLVTLDNIPIMIDESRVYYLINKPLDVVSTTQDTHNRKTVVDLVPDDPRVYPVGRLDADSEGLLILTNDGDLTHRLTHPSFKVEKEYLVKVDRAVKSDVLTAFRRGMELEDGLTSPARIADLGNGVVRITISEGRNRQIRRMLAHYDYNVERLVRTRIGPIADNRLVVGCYRGLSQLELRQLWSAAAPKDE